MDKRIHTIGLDIAKSVFQVHAVDEAGEVVLRRRLPRARVLSFFARSEPCLIGMEACATAHHWARELSALGHRVRLMPPNYVKPYLKRHKNDMADAEAICEAVTRPNMRFVEIKSEEQQSVLVLHGARDALMRIRIQLSNAIRGHLAEFGQVAPKGRLGLQALIARLEEADEAVVPALVRDCLLSLAEQLARVNAQILEMDRRIAQLHRANELSQRLASVPGVGPVTATLLVGTIADPTAFRSGRALSAWIGLTPKQNSSGGRERLGEITKAGSRDLRRLLVAGAMAVIRRAQADAGARHPWLGRLLERRPTKVAAVALANKMARILWAIMTRGESFRPEALRAV